VVALLAAMGTPPDEIRACILSSTTDLGVPGRDPVYGYGLVDAAKSVDCAR
jgi:hypothetical protein